MRVVIDTNVLVSAALTPEGTPGRVVAAWLAVRFEAVTTEELIEEVERVLALDRIRSRLPDQGVHLRIGELLRRAAEVVAPAERLSAFKDPADNRLPETASYGQADVIVSGDGAVLALREIGGTRVLPPSALPGELMDER